MKFFKKGFSLIELLVVIAIIGILAVIVIASLSGARNKAIQGAYKKEVSAFQPKLSAICDSSSSATINAASDMPAGGMRVQGVRVTDCQPDGNFTVTIAPTPNPLGKCTGATITNTTVTFAGC